MPRADKAGFPTWWTSYGQGTRKALMIHCSLAHSGSWGGVARHMSGALEMTAFDLPGHGRSAAWDGRGEIQGVSARIAADFCDGPVDVIGHSFGATVALRLAVEHPELVRSLVLIEPVFFAIAYHDRPDLGAAHDMAIEAFVHAMKVQDYAVAARLFTRTWGEGTAWADIPEPVRAQLAAQMPLIAAADGALFHDAGGMLASGALERIAAQVLLIEGSQSPAIIAAINEGLAARLPRPERAVIAGAAHMAPITHPAQVAAEILRFLRAV